MSRRLASATSARVFSVVLLCSLALAGCKKETPIGPFSVELGSAVQAANNHGVDLAGLPAAPWDELIVFAPGSTQQDVCKTLQLGWVECRLQIPGEIDEAKDRLVFRRHGEVTHCEWHHRANGDFAFPRDGASTLAIARSAARFNVIAAPAGSFPRLARGA